jgi:acyl-CoA thioester hydrolase
MQAPYVGLTIEVPSEWIDVNSHMNATHYGLVVYDAHFNFTEEIGLGEAYVKQTGCGKAVLESHMIYEREVCLGDMLEVRSWLLAVDAKRLHFFHEVYNLSKDVRAATSEQVDIHLDLNLRSSAPMPEVLFAQLKERVKFNLERPLPSNVGSIIRPPVNKWLKSHA